MGIYDEKSTKNQFKIVFRRYNTVRQYSLRRRNLVCIRGSYFEVFGWTKIIYGSGPPVIPLQNKLTVAIYFLNNLIVIN